MKKKYYYIIGSLLCFYGINNYVNIGICIVLCIFLLLHIRDENFEYLFFGLIFFEPILVLPFGGGSFFRIYEILFLIKVIVDIKNNKAKLSMNRFNIFSSLFIIITGFIYKGINAEISLIINTFIIIYILCKKYKNENFYEELLYTMGTMIAFSSIYGFFRGSIASYGTFNRLSTTISDPNYSALFLNIGFFSLLGNKMCGIIEKKILLTIIGISLLLTVSLTGICGWLIFIIIYCFLNNFIKGVKYAFFILVLFIAFICVPIKQGDVLYGLHQRLINVEGSSTEDISSGRTTLLKDYIKNFNQLPIKQFLIGGNNTVSGDYRKFVIKEFSNVSHNSYIDILYMTGIIGLILFLIIFFYGIIDIFKQYKDMKENTINILVLKFILLLFAFTISIFPFRYFIMIFLLSIQESKKIEMKNDMLLLE